MHKQSDKILHWRIDTKPYVGRVFEGGFLGTIIDQNGHVIYAGPDSYNSLLASSRPVAEARAQMICDAVNDYSKLKKLKGKVEDLIYEIHGGMTIKKQANTDQVHKTIHQRKLNVFIASYLNMFGVDLNKLK